MIYTMDEFLALAGEIDYKTTLQSESIGAIASQERGTPYVRASEEGHYQTFEKHPSLFGWVVTTGAYGNGMYAAVSPDGTEYVPGSRLNTSFPYNGELKEEKVMRTKNIASQKKRLVVMKEVVLPWGGTTVARTMFDVCSLDEESAARDYLDVAGLHYRFE